MNYFISDLHFGHYNIIRLCHRPFESVEEMNETLIRNWNSVVSPEDHVYVLGDLCYHSAYNVEYFLRQLKGHKYLIIGNHDKAFKDRHFDKKDLIWAKDYMELHDGEHKIVLSHYPMVEWNGSFRGAIHLYGHIHNNTTNPAYRIMSQIDNAYNVGADILDFIPRTLDEVITYNERFREQHGKGDC